jgi:2-methylcitrate dehydratase PrpD
VDKLGATTYVAKFIIETGFQNLPQRAVEKTKHHILDFFGVTLAGSTYPVAQILKEHLSEVGGESQATSVGFPLKVPCPEAAWANGILGHFLDFDDNSIGLPEPIHQTVTTLPAALSLGETLEVGGRELLTAFMLGIEVASKLDRAIVGHGKRGWHGTGTFGTLGATVAAGKVLKLGVEEMEHAIGIAASKAAGLRSNFGTMTKPLHAGQASRNGVMSALLAKKGFTSCKNILEKDYGFGQLFGQGLDVKYLQENLGKSWEILEPGVHIKLYPSCMVTHSAIDGTLRLIKEQTIDLEQVSFVEVRSKGDLSGLIYSKPKTALEAKFSMEYCVAIALLEGKVTLDEFTDAKVLEPRVQQLIEKIRIVSDSKMEASSPLKTSIMVRMKNGNEYAEFVEYPRGSKRNPITFKEVETKFRDCAKYVLHPKKVQEIIRVIKKLEDMKTSELMTLIHS